MTHDPISSFVLQSLTHSMQCHLTLWGGIKQLEMVRHDRCDTSSRLVVRTKKSLTHNTQWCLTQRVGVVSSNSKLQETLDMTHHPLSSFMQQSLTHYLQWHLTLRGGVKQIETIRGDIHDTSSLFVVNATKSHSLHTVVPHAKGWCQAPRNNKKRHTWNIIPFCRSYKKTTPTPRNDASG
jgi:hypothetical protein